jgi:hypothetical protein
MAVSAKYASLPVILRQLQRLTLSYLCGCRRGTDLETRGTSVPGMSVQSTEGMSVFLPSWGLDMVSFVPSGSGFFQGLSVLSLVWLCRLQSSGIMRQADIVGICKNSFLQLSAILCSSILVHSKDGWRTGRQIVRNRSLPLSC